MTHDSLGIGEDGPTHQPIEQVNIVRATPNVLMFRPADGETKYCIHKYLPSAITPRN